VQAFDVDGQFLTQWGSPGEGEGHFVAPNGICVQNGVAYVVDSRNRRVQVFDVGRESGPRLTCVEARRLYSP
jgi:sugar lactone lactonase YvrE